MEVTPDHYVIRVPRLAGYKTLVVNAVIAIWALVIAIWPELPGEVTPDVVGAWFDQVTGLVVGAVAVINMALRLMSSTPAAPFKRAPGTDDSGVSEDALKRAYLEGKIAGRYEDAVERERQRTVAAALANERIAGPDVLADTWPPLANVKRELVSCGEVDRVEVTSEMCVWPDCACHIRCKDRQPVADLDDVNGDAAAKLSFLDTLTSGPGARAFLSAFLLPSFLLFAGLTVATLAGCAPGVRPTPSLGCDGVQDCMDRFTRRMEIR